MCALAKYGVWFLNDAGEMREANNVLLYSDTDAADYMDTYGWQFASGMFELREK